MGDLGVGKARKLDRRDAPGLPALFVKASLAAGAFSAAVGCLVLAGWTLEVEVLKRIVPGLVAMNPITAVAFVLTGAALLLSGGDREGGRAAARGLALVVALVGLLKLAELYLGWNVGVDRLLFPEKLGAVGDGLPNRMAPNTAFNFLVVGIALSVLDVRVRRGLWPAQILALVTCLASLLALIGYVFGAASLYGVGSYIPMALHTALTFIVVSLGLLCARPNRGLVEIFANAGTGGVVARRLLPAIIVVPTVLGWLRLEGQRAGLYDTAFGAALLVVSSISIFAVMVWWIARAIRRIDDERQLGKEARARLAAIVESSEDAIIGKTLDGIIISWNRGAQRLYGYTSEEVVGMPISVLVPSDRSDEVPAILEKIRRGRSVDHYETVRVTASGRLLDVAITVSPVRDAAGNVTGASTIARDMTGRKEAEERLREAEEKYRSIFENAAEGIFQTTTDGRILTANPTMARMAGYASPEEMKASITDTSQLYADPEERAEFVRLVRRDGGVTDFVVRWRRKDGGVIWVSANARALYGADGELSGFEGAVQDITERKRAEEALRESEQRFRSSFGDASIGMALVSLDGRWLEVNTALCGILGYPEEELLENYFQDVTHPDDLEADLGNVGRILDGETQTYQMEKRYFHKLGHEVWVLLNVSLVRDDADSPLYFISQIQDITERKRAEEALRKS